MTNETLSDKINLQIDENGQTLIVLYVKDVKEFIKRLKEVQCLENSGEHSMFCNCLCCREINQIFGDKLT